MSLTTRVRSLFVLFAVAVAFLSLYLDKAGMVFGQFDSPLAPTPGPRPQLRVVNEITHPQPGDAIAGFTPIVGTAVTTDFIKYDVHISPAGAENWAWLTTSPSIVHESVLHILNSYELSDGYYDIRVRAISRNGSYTEAFVRGLEVRNSNPPTPTAVFDASGVLQPESPLLPGLLFTPTPTPTPLYRSSLPDGQGIFEPQNGAVLRGQTPIVATVNSKTNFNPFDRYEIFIAPSDSPQWNWLYTGTEQKWQSNIYTLDTTQFADGEYDLRLRIVYRDSNYDEYYVSRLRISNGTAGQAVPSASTGTSGAVPGLFFPLSGTQLSGSVDLVGTTAVPDLLRWEIYWSPARREDWRFLVSDTGSTTNATLARLDLRLLPPGSYDFRLRIVRRDYNYADYHIRDILVAPPTPTPVPRLDG